MAYGLWISYGCGALVGTTDTGRPIFAQGGDQWLEFHTEHGRPVTRARAEERARELLVGFGGHIFESRLYETDGGTTLALRSETDVPPESEIGGESGGAHHAPGSVST